MIAVVADDLSGAVEIAGVGLRYGLKVTVTLSADTIPSDTQLWVVALDTRSINKQNAVRSVAHTVKKLALAGIKDIFKKTDSVLRGHITSEHAVQLKTDYDHNPFVTVKPGSYLLPEIIFNLLNR